MDREGLIEELDKIIRESLYMIEIPRKSRLACGIEYTVGGIHDTAYNIANMLELKIKEIDNGD